MARRVNKTIVVGLTFAAMAAVAVGWMVWIGSMADPDPEVRAERGRRLIAEGNYRRGAGHLVAVAQDSGLAKYWMEAGEALWLDGQAGDARHCWAQALSAEPGLKEGYRRLVRASLELVPLSPRRQAWVLVLEDAEKLLASDVDPDSAPGHHARGVAHLNLRTEDPSYESKGLADLEAAVAKAPDVAEYARDLATYRLEPGPDGQPTAQGQAAAEARYQALLSAAPDSATARQYYGEFLGRVGRHDEARQQLDRAVELAPDDAKVRIALALYWFRSKSYDEARAAFNKAVELAPDAYDAYLRLGAMELSLKRPEAALAVYRSRLERGADRHGYKGPLNRIDQFRVILSAGETVLQLASMAADADVREDWVKQADRLLEDAISEIGEQAWTHALRGQIALFRDQTTTAVKEFEMALRATSRPMPLIQLRLAVLYTRQNQFGRAQVLLTELTELEHPSADSPSWVMPTWVQMAQVQNRLQLPALASRTADQVLAADPGNQGALREKIDALQALALRTTDTRIRADLRAQAAKLVEQHRGSAEDERRTAIALKFLQNDLAGAEEELLAVLEEDPSDEAVVNQLVVLYVRQERHADAQRIVDRALTASPDSPVINRLRVSLQMATATGLTEAERAAKYKRLLEETPDPFERALALAALAVRSGEFAEARPHLDQAETLQPESRLVAERQFGLALAQRDWSRASAYATRCGELDIDGARGRTHRGRLHLGKAEQARAQGNQAGYTNELELAVVELQAALEEYPASSMAQTWLGIAYRALGRLGDAREAIAVALELNPTNGSAHKQLAQMAYAEGDNVGWARHLAAAQRGIPQDPWVKAMAAFQLEMQDPSAAIARREALRTKQPDNAGNLSRLVDLYLVAAKSDSSLLARAEDAISEARRLAPDNLSLVVRASQMFGQNDKADRGEVILQEWIAGQSDAARKAGGQLALGRYYERFGTPEQVDAAFRAAVELDESRPTCIELAEWLQRTQRVDQAAEWYARAIAHAEGDAQQLRLRLRTIEVFLSAGMLDAADEQITALRSAFPEEPRGFLAQGSLDLARGRTREALSAFDTLLEREPTNPGGFYRRGLLHYRQSRWGPCITDLERAKTLRPDGFNHEHRILLARALERSGQADAAIRELEGLRTRNPEALGVVRSLVEMYERLGRDANAHAMVVEYTNRYPDDSRWAHHRGLLALRLGHRDEGLEWLLRATTKSGFEPAPMEAYLAALVRLGRWDAILRFISSDVPDAKRSPAVLRRLAFAQAKQGDATQAIETIDLALAGVSTWQVVAGIAGDLIQLHGSDGAMQYVEQQAGARPDQAGWGALHGVMLANGRRTAKATTRFETALSNATRDAQRLILHQLLGQQWYARKEYGKARQAWEAALALDPTSRGVLNNLAFMLAEHVKQPDAALPFAQRAVAAHPNDANALDTLGWTQYLRDDMDAALGALLRAIQIDPERAAVHYHAGRVYQKRGERDGARREYLEASRLGERSGDTESAEAAKTALRELGGQS